MEIQPTPNAYAELQEAFEHFNRALFDQRLPDCLITLQRRKHTMGYFASARFIHHSGHHIDEIAMNPGYFAVRSIRETLSTLVHEMTHAWQFHHGKPGRRGYHNKEWGSLMEARGLMPSDTGEPNGKRVGEKMTHYIIPDGLYDRACIELLTREFRLSWFDRFPMEVPVSIDPAGLDLIEPPAPVNRSNRLKYACSNCGSQAWGKPNLSLVCGVRACDYAPFELRDGEPPQED